MTKWTVRMAAAAERDFQGILEWTGEQFGQIQVRVYADTIIAALEALASGPEAARAKPRSEILPGLFSLHTARDGRKGRHLVLLRVDRERNVVEVLRFLHDSMDLARHLPEDRSGL
ncbi:MAG TPA: type II toxin-antitoxin system RelE/ParE family toxin [Rhizomicrobium sp.]|nr:type II toxin-antitoxin system RelE/ParE family toxin [Rhizomicrobium sp.]